MYKHWLQEVEEEIAEERGFERGKEEMAKNLLVRGDYSLEIISEIADLPVERVRMLIN